MIIPSQELCIIPLEKGHNLSSFTSSNEDLNDFLHNDACKSQEDLISRTYLCVWQSRLAGFFTLVTDTIEVKLVEQEDGIDDYNYQKYPAIKMARMAVDEKLSGAGIGRYLLLAAVGKVHHPSQEVGCRYITAASKGTRPIPARPSWQRRLRQSGHNKQPARPTGTRPQARTRARERGSALACFGRVNIKKLFIANQINQRIQERQRNGL